MDLGFIGKYELLSTLGQGSTGLVYLVRDSESQKTYALKALKAYIDEDTDSGQEILTYFNEIAQSLRSLNHPSIIKTVDSNLSLNGIPYVVMEIAQGKSLRTRLAQDGHLEQVDAVHFLAQISSGVDYLNRFNLLHRDIKPEKIFIDESNRIKILGYPILKTGKSSGEVTSSAHGTPSYMSPEQIRGEELDVRSSVFTLAVLVFEMFTGIRPFKGSDFTTIVNSILNTQPSSIMEYSMPGFGQSFPGELNQILEKALSKNRNDRFSSTLDFAQAVATSLNMQIDGNGLVRFAGGTSSNFSAIKQVSTKRPDYEIDMVAKRPTVSLGPQEVNDLVENIEAWDAQESNKSSLFEELFEEPQEKDLYDLPKYKEKKRANKIPNETSSVTALRFIFSISLIVGFLGTTGFVIYNYVIQRNDLGPDGSIQIEQKTADEINIKPSTSEAVSPPADIKEESKPDLSAQVAKLNEKPLEKDSKDSPNQEIAALEALSNQELIDILNNLNSNDTVGSRGNKKKLEAVLIVIEKRPSEEFVPSLLKLSSNRNFSLRAKALKALSNPTYLGLENVVETIIDRASDKEFIVRGFAVLALAKIPSERILRVLQERLKVENNELVTKHLEDAIQELKKTLES